MKRYDLSDFSIVIPARIDCQERLEHLKFLLQYFRRFFIHCQIIIVEHDAAPKIDFALDQVEFLESAEEFSTARAGNIGASLVKTPFFCKCDIDAVIHPKAFYDALERLKSNSQTSFVVPYNGVSFTLKAPIKEELMRSFEFKTLPFVQPEHSDSFHSASICLKSNDSVGLIHCFRTSVFKALGGYNEEFVGWGYEDNEITARFKCLGHPKELIKDYNAFHFDHPRMEGSKFQVFQNMCRWRLVETMPRHQLVEYIKTWTRFF